MARSRARPVTPSDREISQRHIRETMALTRQKISDHRRAAARTSNSDSEKYHESHIKAHQKELKADQKLVKKNGGS